MTVAVITSIYGNHDWLVDPIEQDGVDEYIAVVDQPQSGSCGMWRQIVEPRPHMHPRLAAKVAKCLPWRYTKATHTLWVDGSARFKHPGVAKWATEAIGDNLVAQFRHPERHDIEPEAHVSSGMSKYDGQAMLEQVASYKKAGLPLNFGLWATGFMARCCHPHIIQVGYEWLEEQIIWTYQDQLSLPFVYWHQDLYPVQLEGDLWGNPHVYFEAHR
jgi:hypothetical protein